jgi:hypothetical protein
MTAWTETQVTKLNTGSVAATVSRLTGTWPAKNAKVRPWPRCGVHASMGEV